MKTTIIASVLASLLAIPVMAEEVKLGALTISGPFARASAGKAKAGGGFMTIMNKGEADKLIAVSSGIAKRTELHTHIKDGDVMRMREVDHVDVPNGMVELKPGSYHVMFMGLKQPLKEGQTVPVELTFEKAGKVSVDIKVGPVGAKTPMEHSHMSHKKH